VAPTAVARPAMMNRVRRRIVGSLAFGGVAGLAYPYAELWWKCRSAVDSEACVWARAYFPLSRWVEPAIVIPTVCLLTLLVLAIVDREQDKAG
jgi:hypothetical protein